MADTFTGDKKKQKDLSGATHDALMATLKCIENDAKSGTPSAIKTTADLAPVLQELVHLWRELNVEWQPEAIEGLAEPVDK